MQSEYEATLTEVFCDVLMKYAFMFGDISTKEEFPVDGTNYLHATIDFTGYRSGTLGISTSSDLCVQLAANVLGVDPDDENSINDAADALEELINIVCGQFLTTVFGEELIFDLSPPSVLQIGKAGWKRLLESEKSIGFMLDDIPAVIYVSVDAGNKETDDDTGSDRR